MNNIKQLLLISVYSLTLTACTSFKDFAGAPTINGAQNTKIEALGNDRFAATQTVANWWKTLQDNQLNGLISRSLENNKDVSIAIANLFEAREIAREAGFDRYPTVTARGSASRTRTSGENGTGDSTVRNNVDAGFDAAWELDLFGRVSEGVKASDARAQAAQANLRDA